MSGESKWGWAIGGICKPMVEMLQKGKVGKVIDVQDFDLDAVNSIHRTPGHFEMSASQYANPANKGAFVNSLDFVVLAALEIDTGFNVNVLTGSDGVLRGAPGGHPDTAAGSKCCIIVTPPDPRADGHGVRARGHRHHPRRLRGRAGHRLRHRRQPVTTGFDRMSGQSRHPPCLH